MIRTLYCTYQLLIAAPILVVLTALTAIVTTIGCTIGKPHIWGYYPGCLWSRAFLRLLLLPVHTRGYENLDKSQSYVFVANHQGAFDIFLIYGFIGRNFKWMMKQSLRGIPLVGKACESAGHVFVNRTSAKTIEQTIDQARQVLQRGTSLVVFPEGERTLTGQMGVFRKGAFQLATEIGLPVVPVTIEGSYRILPRQKGVTFVRWSPISLAIHKPIPSQGREMKELMEEARNVILNSTSDAVAP